MTPISKCLRIQAAGFTRFGALFLAGLLAAALAGCGTPAATASWPGVAVNGDTAYLSYGYYVSAVNVASGASLWKYPEKMLQTETFYGKPTIDSKGRVVVGSYSGQIAQLDPATGVALWVTPADFNKVKVIGPITEDSSGNYIVPLDNGTLLVLDSATGRLASTLNLTKVTSWGPIAVDGTTLYIGALEHEVLAYDTTTNAVIWSKDLGDSVAGGVTLAEGKILAGTFGDKVVALDAATGSLLWEVSTKGWVWSPPTVDAGVAYVTDLSGTIQALYLTDGTLVWQKDLASPAQIAPVVTGTTVLVGTKDGKLRALSTADGTQLWEQTLEDGAILGNLVVSGDLVLVTGQGGKYQLSAVRIASGAIAWNVTQPTS